MENSEIKTKAVSHLVSTKWIGGMAFEADIEGYKVKMDAHPEHGGNNVGPSPKPLTLASLSGCTAMDVVSILGKMQAEYTSFNIRVEGELASEHPKIYTKINVVYAFTCPSEPDKSKFEKAVKLSWDKYCGVAAMLKQSSELSYSIEYIIG